MPRLKKLASTEATIDHIKAVARQEMEKHGTHGLTIRGISKALNLSAMGLYHYFPSIHDLITALIVDDFTALAEELEQSSRHNQHLPVMERLIGVLIHYRMWAIQHPINFQLIYGNPIPSYSAPAELTVPLVVRGFTVISALIEEAIQGGHLRADVSSMIIYEGNQHFLDHLIRNAGYPISTTTLYYTMILWTHMHGIIALELYGHLGPSVGDVATFYHAQLLNWLHTMGWHDKG